MREFWQRLTNWLTWRCGMDCPPGFVARNREANDEADKIDWNNFEGWDLEKTK